MTGPLKEDCPDCHGQGIVPHAKRRMGNGEPDPADFHTHDVCEKCGGGGRVLVNPKAVEERKPGNIADQIGEFTG